MNSSDNNAQQPEVNAETVKHLLQGVLMPCEAGDEAAGDWIGGFRLLERLGEGGFGVVWSAEQEQPVRREVAVKLIKLGMDSREVLARFEQERHMLAAMQHPCIAGMIDAGLTEDGRPFFVMERVHGLPLTQHAREKKMPLRERLELFIELCHGVQHAHQKAVIHRDLKPSNVLVAEMGGRPVPKIIDFGIAKALTSEKLTSLTLATRTGTALGTPLYMAPEQFGGTEVVDTRGDVYALGALLYELLVDEPPFPAKTLTAKGEEEMRRIICQVPPPRPSRRLVGQKLPADLDWITLKALEKQPRRRYSSADELAADVERFLTDEPVRAHPPEWSYLTGLWVKRHRAACAAILISAAAMIAGSALALWQASEAKKERNLALEHEAGARQAEAHALQQTALAVTAEKQAVAEKARAEQTAAFLSQLLENAAEEVGKGRNPEALTGALALSQSELMQMSRDPALKADLLERISALQREIGNWQDAIRSLRERAVVLAQMHGAASEAALKAELEYLKREADHGERAAVPQRLLELEKRVESANGAGSKLWFDVRREQSRVWLKLDDGPRGLDVTTRTLAEAERLALEGQHLLNVRISHVVALEFTGQFDEALKLLVLCRRTAVSENAKAGAVDTIEKRMILTLEARGDHAGGAEVLRSRLERQRTEKQAPSVLVETLLQLARFESAAGQHAAAPGRAREALDLARRSVVTQISNSLLRLASSESAAGSHEEAVKHAREAEKTALEQGRRRDIVSAQEELAWVLHAAGRLDEAYAVWDENRQLQTESPNFKSIFYPLEEMAAIRSQQNRPAEALALIRDAWRHCLSHPLGTKDTGEQGYLAGLALKYRAQVEKASPGTPAPADLAAWQKARELYLTEKKGKGRAEGDKGPTPNFRVKEGQP